MGKSVFFLKSWITIAIGLSVIISTNGIDFNPGQVYESAKDITSGIAYDLMKSMPSPSELFDTSKQLIAGYPFEVIASAINEICSSALQMKTLRPRYIPNINELQFQLHGACNTLSVTLENATEILRSPEFDPKKKVVVVVTGWGTNPNETSTIDEFAKAYACRGGFNFVSLDTALYVDTLYTWSAFNTQYLGKYMAKGLEKLIKIIPLENIHLIGHSLGAHIVGAAGRYFQEYTNLSLPRITGLDPAKPCFNEGEVLTGLMRGDADFVDVIHSNPGVLGKRNPLGDIDFYPSGLQPLPYACYTITCAHRRAWEYFVETIYPGNEDKYIGVRCNSLSRLRDGKCKNNWAIMGYAAPTNKKGNYFLDIKEEPFSNFDPDNLCCVPQPKC